MWTIPPIVGQKVMLNPSYPKFEAFRRQAQGGDGYAIIVEGLFEKWMSGNVGFIVYVIWENTGKVNAYNLEALLPLSTFKEVKRVNLKSGAFIQLLAPRDERQLEDRVIKHGDDVKDYNIFDKEQRIKKLQFHIDKYERGDEELKQNEQAQIRYAGVLEELERTKRANPTRLFLDVEGEVRGDDSPFPF